MFTKKKYYELLNVMYHLLYNHSWKANSIETEIEYIEAVSKKYDSIKTKLKFRNKFLD